MIRDDVLHDPHIKLHFASRHPAIRLSRRTTVTAAILPPTDPEKIGEVQKKMLHAACQMTDIITWRGALISR